MHIHQGTPLNTWSVMSRDVPGITAGFGSFSIMHPPPGDPAEVDQTSRWLAAITPCKPSTKQGHIDRLRALGVVFVSRTMKVTIEFQ